MKLKLKELQSVAKATMKEEKALNNFREEIVNVLGPSVNVLGSHNYFASFVNDHLDVLESTGRFPKLGSVKISALVEASNSRFAEVRKVVARLLPENFVAKFLNDTNSTVRCAAAKRLPYSVIKESAKFYPSDDQLQSIARSKRIYEAGLPAPKVVEEPFDLYGDEPLGDTVKTHQGEELSDAWYDLQAHKLCSIYGTNLEGQWEETLASRIASSNFASGKTPIDREKMLAAIKKSIRDREDRVLEEGSLRSIVNRLRSQEYLDEAVMPVIEEVADPVRDLLETSCSSAEYVKLSEALFGVKKSQVPPGIRKYRLGEGYNADTQIPVLAQIPNGMKITPTVEKALDLYVSSWNKQQSMQGEPYRLSWSPHPSSANLVGFNLELK